MKSIAIVKLTGNEIKTIVDAYKILEELERHVAHTSFEEEVGGTIYLLDNIIDELEVMGNNFSVLLQEEEEIEEVWEEDEDDWKKLEIFE